MFFTMKPKKTTPHIPDIYPLRNVSLANVMTTTNTNLQFGMISRIQEKTNCFSCGK